MGGGLEIAPPSGASYKNTPVGARVKGGDKARDAFAADSLARRE